MRRFLVTVELPEGHPRQYDSLALGGALRELARTVELGTPGVLRPVILTEKAHGATVELHELPERDGRIPQSAAATVRDIDPRSQA